MPHRVFGSTLCLCSLDVSSTSFPKMRLDISKSLVSNVDWCYVILVLSFTKYCQIVLQIGCTNLIRSVHECLALPIIWFCYCCKCFHCDIAPNIFFTVCITLITRENMHLFICLLELWGFFFVGAAFWQKNKEFSSCFNCCSVLNNSILWRF